MRRGVLAILLVLALGLYPQTDLIRLGAQPAAGSEQGAGAEDATSAAGEAPLAEVRPDDRVLGDADAPVTIIEYTSLTCPHCADFHTKILPKLRDAWIEPGKVKLIYRHYPLDKLSLAAALLTNCFDEDRFFQVIERMFARQEAWARSDEPVQVLREITRSAGMDDSTFDACVSDQAAANEILADRKVFAEQAQIRATPTFLIGDVRIQGARSYDAFDQVLDNAYRESQ